MEVDDAVFSLQEVIDAIESASDDAQWFANIETGELYCRFGNWDFFDEIENVYDDKWLSMPGRYERNDWRTMRDFAYELGGATCDELLDAIHGKGAFRNFRRCVERLGALQSWYAYKDERNCQLAIDWLEAHGLSWKDDRLENAKRDWHALLPIAFRMQLQVIALDCTLSICKLDKLPKGLIEDGFCCVTRTEDELSVVCETSKIPDDALAREDGWKAFKVLGPLDFELVGILAKISAALANANVPLFAISTYDTDYILVKEEHFDSAVVALREEDYDVTM